MAAKERPTNLDEAADDILNVIEDHAAKLPSNEREVRLNAFGDALSKAAQRHRPTSPPSFGTRVFRLLFRKRG